MPSALATLGITKASRLRSQTPTSSRSISRYRWTQSRRFSAQSSVSLVRCCVPKHRKCRGLRQRRFTSPGRVAQLPAAPLRCGVAELVRGPRPPGPAAGKGCAGRPGVCRASSPFRLLTRPAHAWRRGRRLPEPVLPGERPSAQAFSKPHLPRTRSRPAGPNTPCGHGQPLRPGTVAGPGAAPGSGGPAWSCGRGVCVKCPLTSATCFLRAQLTVCSTAP